MSGAAQNTDKRLWARESSKEGEEPYKQWASVFMTQNDEGLGICVGGHCIVRPIEQWHKMMKLYSENFLGD